MAPILPIPYYQNLLFSVVRGPRISLSRAIDRGLLGEMLEVAVTRWPICALLASAWGAGAEGGRTCGFLPVRPRTPPRTHTLNSLHPR